MKVMNWELFEIHAKLCQMLGNPKRLAIVAILQHGEMSVGDLAEAMDTSITTVSQHLRLMKDRNVVDIRKDGHTVFYHLKNHKLVKACKIIREVLLDDLKQHGKIADDFDSDTMIKK